MGIFTYRYVYVVKNNAVQTWRPQMDSVQPSGRGEGHKLFLARYAFATNHRAVVAANFVTQLAYRRSQFWRRSVYGSCSVDDWLTS